jgi:hypothetical protein
VSIDELATEARRHADLIRNDVELAANREEHIRLTARLNEAEKLADALSEASGKQPAAE